MTDRFDEELEAYEREGEMRYIPRVEPYCAEKARQKGIEQGIERGERNEARESVLGILKVRFGNLREPVSEAVRRVEDLEQLRVLQARGVVIDSPDDLVQELLH